MNKAELERALNALRGEKKNTATTELHKRIEEVVGNKLYEKAEELLGEKVEAIHDLLKVQEQHCVNDYQIGLYNGLAIGLSVLTGESPQFHLNGEEDKDNSMRC